MRFRLPLLILCSMVALVSCDKEDGSGRQAHSYSICPMQVTPGLDVFNQVTYRVSGLGLANYSSFTVCMRRVTTSGSVRTYDEIIDSRSDPNSSVTYKTYKKLAIDETGVKIRYVELTERDTGTVTRYENYQ